MLNTKISTMYRLLAGACMCALKAPSRTGLRSEVPPKMGGGLSGSHPIRKSLPDVIGCASAEGNVMLHNTSARSPWQLR